MKSLKSLTASIIAGAFALAGACVILPACSSTASEGISTAINSLSTAIAAAVENGTAAQVVEQAEAAGAIDSSTADAIEAILPVAGTVASTVASATASTSTDSASKNEIQPPAFDKAKLDAILKAHASGINPDKVPAALKAVKGIKPPRK